MISFLRYIYNNSFRSQRSKDVFGYMIIAFTIVSAIYVCVVTFYVFKSVSEGSNVEIFGIKITRPARPAPPDLSTYAMSNTFERLDAGNIEQCKTSVAKGLNALNYASVNATNANSVFGTLSTDKANSLISVRCFEADNEIYYFASSVAAGTSSSLKMVDDLATVLKTKTLTAPKAAVGLYRSYYSRDFFVTSEGYDETCDSIVGKIRGMIPGQPSERFEQSGTYRYLFEDVVAQYDCWSSDGAFAVYSIYMSYSPTKAGELRNQIRKVVSEREDWLLAGIGQIIELPAEISVPDSFKSVEECQRFIALRTADAGFIDAEFVNGTLLTQTESRKSILAARCPVVNGTIAPDVALFTTIRGPDLDKLETRVNAAFD